jgi:carbonic anhydrase-like protein
VFYHEQAANRFLVHWLAGCVTMNRIFYFDSPSEPYVADAVVLSCFDQRIRLVVNKFLQRRGILKPDMVVVAGGAKTLASPRNDFERDFILEQVRMSMALHGTTRMFLMSHSDCATYGGLAAFKGDRELEKAHHQDELRRGAELLKETFPQLEVERFFVSFEGVFAVESAGVSKSA